MIDIALIIEDRRFQDIVEPAIAQLAENVGVTVVVRPPTNLRGCRLAALRQELQSLEGADIVVVAADAMGQGRSRRTTFRRKARALHDAIVDTHPRISLAVAEPSVEAWLMADVSALARGLTETLGTTITPPTSPPHVPRSEREAKRVLGQLIHSMVGEPLIRCGFEFADSVVGQLDLLESRSPSLRAWAHDLKHHLSGLASEAGGSWGGCS